ncbi:2-C-methyl-D-erythritol 2,4-cyclodiphosphate synthase [Candidatus Pelagibacter sp.]|nr:2-C-methyl-D-erythritol 2,4-cyclodiphosphate synthase [Candidatus Pelagibacter sp.]
MSNCFIILAAGQSKRFKSINLKQYTYYRNKPIYEHSLDKIIKSKLFKYIILVTNKKSFIKKKYLSKIKVLKGGKERSDSSLIAIKYAKRFKVKNVLVHDAARPNFSLKLVKNVLINLRKYKAVVPYVNSTDAIKYNFNHSIYNLKKENIYLTQTPQGFRYKDIYNLAKNNKIEIQDESSLFINNNSKVKFINGEIKNNKITYKNDLKNITTFYGIGFDVHRLVRGRKLYLGGLKIKSLLGTLGHSDGDPVLHAITDAILGACKKGDIGQKFSDKNSKYKNIRSSILLSRVIKEVGEKSFYINNLDINIITQTPKISKYRNKIIKSISDICRISKNKINIKGKTTEKLGLIGKERAIACEVIASISKYDL